MTDQGMFHGSRKGCCSSKDNMEVEKLELTIFSAKNAKYHY